MRMSRLFEIVYYLLNDPNATAGKLAERFEVSVRTIYRDLDELSAAGIPVYASKGKGGGIRIADGFVLSRSLLSEQEQHDILSGLEALKLTRSLQSDAALEKLNALFQKSATHWIEVDFSDWSGDGHAMFDLIKQAILSRRLIAFDYYSSFGEMTHRTVEPLLMWFKHRSWYLKAFDPAKQAERLFKLSRMKRVVALEEHFEPRALPWPDQPCEREKPLVRLRLEIDSSQCYRIYDEFDDNMVHCQPNGTYLCEAVFLEDDWLYGFILSFGPSAKVLEPARIRDNVIDRLKKNLDQYKT